MNDFWTGLGYMTLCCGTPAAIGFITGWIMRQRFIQHGFPGMLIPGFIRRLF